MKYRKTGEQFLSSVDAMTTKKECEELCDEAKSEGFGEPGAKLYTAADMARAYDEGVRDTWREGRKEAAKLIFAKAKKAGWYGYLITAGAGEPGRLDDYLYAIHTALLAEGKKEGEE